MHSYILLSSLLPCLADDDCADYSMLVVCPFCRRESEELKAAAAPTKASGPAAVPLVSDAASSELAARLKLRAQKLSQEEQQQQGEQQ